MITNNSVKSDPGEHCKNFYSVFFLTMIFAKMFSHTFQFTLFIIILRPNLHIEKCVGLTDMSSYLIFNTSGVNPHFGKLFNYLLLNQCTYLFYQRYSIHEWITYIDER